MLGKNKKPHKLSHEILGILIIVLVISLVLVQLLCVCGMLIVDHYCVMKAIEPTEVQWIQLDNWVWNVSILISVLFFIILFLFLLGERFSYIREVMRGIDAMQAGNLDHEIPKEGNNEITRLAEAVNELSKTQKEVKEKEKALAEEKEQLVRSLSHDIRTPLTSIVSYTELLLTEKIQEPEMQKEYLQLIDKKAGQIRELTEVLLDGGRRKPEWIPDARLLVMQLLDEMEDILEEPYIPEMDMEACQAVEMYADVQELRRIFDNLASNIQKYADPRNPISISIATNESCLRILQKNRKAKKETEAEGYQIGLKSIQRIVHNYNGSMKIQQDDSAFEIELILSLKA